MIPLLLLDNAVAGRGLCEDSTGRPPKVVSSCILWRFFGYLQVGFVLDIASFLGGGGYIACMHYGVWILAIGWSSGQITLFVFLYTGFRISNILGNGLHPAEWHYITRSRALKLGFVL